MTSTSSASARQVITDNSLDQIGISSLFARSPLQTDSTPHNPRPRSSITPLTTANPDRIAPRARLAAISTITTASTTQNFRITYSDRGKINKRSINARDILVTGPNGFRQFASLVNVRLNRAGTSAVANYRINAVGGSWDAADNGAYTVAVQRRQVSDASRNFVRAGRLGNFQVNVSGSITPPPTNPLPTAAFGTGNFSNASTYTFTVNYADNTGVNVTSIDSTDLLVTGPNNFSQAATLVGVSPTGNGTPRTATYAVTAPGGTWDNPDNGTYTIALQANQVSDIQGAFATAANIGTFQVNQTAPAEQQAPTVTGFSAPTITANGAEAQFTVTYADNVGIAFASLGNGDVQVIGPNGFSQLATFVSANSGDGTPRTATYRITAPGGSWGAIDNGAYTVAVVAGQISDVNGNNIVAAIAGNFPVNLPGTDDTLTGSGTGNNTINGGTGNDTVSYAALTTGINADLSINKVLKPTYGGIFNPRIMPLGDSITSGQHANAVPGAYRVELFNNYTTEGFGIDLVGSATPNGPTPNFDRDHNGYPGQTIDQLRSTVSAAGFFASPPDVILLMVGTNDTGGDYESRQEMRDDLTDLLTRITTDAPNAQVLVSTIAPITPPAFNNATRNTRRSEYNSDLQGVVDAFITQGKNIRRVNAGGGLASGDIGGDGIHPTEAGYNKMGDLWYDILTDRDTLSSVENVVGTSFVDTLVGDTGVNVITGNGGSDRLTGGGGADTFVYRSASEGNDTIVDFTATDFLQISAAGFGGGLAAGVGLSEGTPAATGVFVNGTTAVGTNANFLFSGGVLSFDADGTGTGTAVAIANLGGSTLTASQFNIVA